MPAPVVSRPTTPDAPAVSVTPMPRPSGLMRLTALKFPLLARAADTMPMGMTLCDASRPDYPIVYCNPGFERLAGFTADEVLSRPFEQSHLRSKMERMIVVARLDDAPHGRSEVCGVASVDLDADLFPLVKADYRNRAQRFANLLAFR